MDKLVPLPLPHTPWTQVIGTFTFTTTSGSTQSQTVTFSRPLGNFFDNTYNMRWIRFMSFVPNNGASNAALDTNDMGYMKNAQFTGLYLYTSSGAGVKWDSSLVQYAWSVQTGNILPGGLSIGGITPNSVSNSDSFSVMQQVWYGRRCITFDNK